MHLGKIVPLRGQSSKIIEKSTNLIGHRLSSVVIECVKMFQNLLIKHEGHEAIQKLTGFREHNVVPLEWWFGTELRSNAFATLSTHSNSQVTFFGIFLLRVCFFKFSDF